MLAAVNIRALQMQRRYGPPPSEVLDDPEKRRKTGRIMPDVMQGDITEDRMPSPGQREDAAQTLRLDP